MAKFINEKELINNYVNDYLNTTAELSKYIQGSPTFVTYYNKNLLASTQDMGLKAVHEIIGAESPIRYNKINNFPLYNLSELPVQIGTDDDQGTDTSIEGEAVILPDCGITPLIDDVFIISYDTRKLTFRVVDVQISDISSTPLYKISYVFTRANLSVLEQNQISKEYETSYDNIGKSNAAVVLEKTAAKNVELLTELRQGLIDKYTRLFYNSDLNTFVIAQGNKLLYDNYLMEFIQQHGIFLNKKTFMKNICIEPLLPMTQNDVYNYGRTIYSNITEDTYKAWSLDPDYLYYAPIDSSNPTTIFNVYKHRYAEMIEIKHFKSAVSSIKLELDDRVKRYLILLREMESEDFDQTRKESELKDLTEDLLDYKFTTYSEKNYYNVPMIIVIIDKLIENLQGL